jgi:hypothetical protein
MLRRRGYRLNRTGTLDSAYPQMALLPATPVRPGDPRHGRHKAPGLLGVTPVGLIVLGADLNRCVSIGVPRRQYGYPVAVPGCGTSRPAG